MMTSWSLSTKELRWLFFSFVNLLFYNASSLHFCSIRPFSAARQGYYQFVINSEDSSGMFR